MNNLFWFLHKPVDERERLLYLRAYQRVLGFWSLLLLVGFVLFSVPVFGKELTLRPKMIALGIELLLYISVIVGWTALRKDELEIQTAPEKEVRPKISTLVATYLLILVNTVLVLRLFPQYYLFILFIAVFGGWAIYILYAWRASRHMLLPIRILLCCTVPIIVLVYVHMSHRTSVVVRVIKSLLVSWVLLFVIAISSAVGITLGGTSSYYIQTDHFAPDVPKQSRVFATRSFQELVPGDYVIYLHYQDESGRPTLGKVLSQEGEEITIEHSTGEETVSVERIIAKVIELKGLRWEKMERFLTSVWTE